MIHIPLERDALLFDMVLLHRTERIICAVDPTMIKINPIFEV